MRPKSVRKPVLDILAREVGRIQKRQLDAIAARQEPEPLTDREMEILEKAAKVSALLERVKPGEDEGDVPAGDGDVDAALKRVEAKKAKATPSADEEVEP